jgi:hypothetical protein
MVLPVFQSSVGNSIRPNHVLLEVKGGAPASIVHDDDYNRDILPNQGIELGEAIANRAIAGDEDRATSGRGR